MEDDQCSLPATAELFLMDVVQKYMQTRLLVLLSSLCSWRLSLHWYDMNNGYRRKSTQAVDEKLIINELGRYFCERYQDQLLEAILGKCGYNIHFDDELTLPSYSTWSSNQEFFVGGERRTPGGEMLPTRTPTVGWRASAVRCTESERFCEAAGVSIVAGKVCSIRGRFWLFCKNLAVARSISSLRNKKRRHAFLRIFYRRGKGDFTILGQLLTWSGQTRPYS